MSDNQLTNILENMGVLEEALKNDNFDDAKELLGLMKPVINDPKRFIDPIIRTQLEKIYHKAQWVCCSMFKTEEVITMLKERIRLALELEIDIWPKLRDVLLTISVYEDRDLFRRHAREALAGNTERFGKRSEVGTFGILITIGQWITVFSIFLGDDKGENTLKIAEFLTRNSQAASLKPEDKKDLSMLFKTYQQLLRSSVEPLGVEERYVYRDESGKLYIGGRGTVDIVGHDTDWVLAKLSNAPLDAVSSATPVANTAGVMINIQEALQKKGLFAPTLSAVAELLSHDPLPQLDEVLKKWRSGQRQHDNILAIMRVSYEDGVFKQLLQYPPLETLFKEGCKNRSWKLGCDIANTESKGLVARLRFVLENVSDCDESLSALIATQVIDSISVSADDPVTYIDESNGTFHWTDSQK